MKRIYLDHNATTPVRDEVREAMLPLLTERFGNPSSAHWAGRETAGYLGEARSRVARLVGANPDEIVFTSGGTEGDNMSLRGVMLGRPRGSHIVSAMPEHPAVKSTCLALEALGYTLTLVSPDGQGIIQPSAIEAAMRNDTAFVSVMLANNETGVINPVREIAAIARRHGALMHTDAVQAVGKMPIDVGDLGVDLLTASGHKYNAPKGVGFQFVRKGVRLVPLVTGGHQEHDVRSGTENLPGIVALGKASELALTEMQKRAETIGALRRRLEEGLLRAIPHTRLNGHPTLRVYNTINISIRYVEGEAMLAMLDRAGIAVSTGSACSSGRDEPSAVLTSMGLDAVCARGALRFSLGYGITDDDIDYCLDVIPPMARRLQGMSPLYPGD